MFCPFCGVKNHLEEKSCFVCRRNLPSLDSELPIAANGERRQSRNARPTTLRPNMARMRDRLVALLLDLLFVSAVLFVSAAALWSRRDVIRDIDRNAMAVTAVAATALLIFAYHWILETAFGATIGKAFAGIRVIRREQPLSIAARAGVMALWLAAIGGAVWGAFVLAPQWFAR